MLQSLGLPIEGSWPDIVLAAVLGVLLGWLLFGREREVSMLRGKLQGAKKALAERKRRIHELETVAGGGDTGGAALAAAEDRIATLEAEAAAGGSDGSGTASGLQGQLDQARGVIANFEREVADLRQRLEVSSRG